MLGNLTRCILIKKVDSCACGSIKLFQGQPRFHGCFHEKLRGLTWHHLEADVRRYAIQYKSNIHSCSNIKMTNATMSAPFATASEASAVILPQLDRTAFQQTIPLKALSIPKQLCHMYMRNLKSFILSRPRVKAVVAHKDPERRLILLKPDITSLEDAMLPKDVKEALASGTIEEKSYGLELDYSQLSCEDILKEILPKGWEIPSSFETIGHIAHMNLREEYAPYKHLIGQVIMDKNSAIKTVVNKTGILENTFRVLPLEVIAGEDQMVTTVKQHTSKFVMNYAEVYWNSRLEEEHKRLVALFKPGEIVADVMAGIGPFAIPAAQQGNEVFANDLNPRSFYYLKENIKLNKVTRLVHPFKMDGRAFIRLLAGVQPQAPLAAPQRQTDIGDEDEGDAAAIPSGLIFHHVVMNLPASAVEFLDAFQGSFRHDVWRERQLPMVHVYTFARTAEADAEIKSRVESHLGCPISEDLGIRLVRDVAPNKRMMRVSFRIPAKIAFKSPAEAPAEKTDVSRETKRAKLCEHE